VDLYIHSSIRLQGVLLNYLSTGTPLFLPILIPPHCQELSNNETQQIKTLCLFSCGFPPFSINSRQLGRSMHTDILLLPVKSCNRAPSSVTVSYSKVVSSEMVWKVTSWFKFPSIDNTVSLAIFTS
jgi:hypothetical protein